LNGISGLSDNSSKHGGTSAEITTTITTGSASAPMKGSMRNGGKGKNNHSCQTNSIIYESTTTLHTSTKTTTLKVGKGAANNMFESNLDILTQEKLADRTEFLKRMRKHIFF
jgi:hypothetical protein